MKKIINVLILFLSFIFLVSCFGTNDNQNPEQPETPEVPENDFEYDPLVVTLVDNCASWEFIFGTDYEMSINGVSTFVGCSTTETYFYEDTVFKIRIVDYDRNPLSDWSNTVTYVVPEPVTVNITFVSPEGLFKTFEQRVEVDSGNMLPAPKVDGYSFYGWHLEEEYTEGVKLFSTMPWSVTTDTTMYAKFIPNQYKLIYNDYTVWVDFYSEGKRIDFDSVSINDSKLEYPTQPEREGYIFTGWYTDEECKNYFNPNTYLTEDINLYAGWYSENNLMYNSRFNDDNYDWKLDTFLGSNLKTSIIVHSGASLLAPMRLSFAVWEEKTYKLQYRILDFTADCQMFLVDEYNDVFIAKVYPDFSQTFESIEFEGVPGHVYTIYLFNSNNNPKIELQVLGSYPDLLPRTPNSTLVTFNEYFTVPTFEKENLQFYGYFTEPNGQGIQITDAEGNSLQPFNYPQETTIYPYYDEITYNINYEANGGSLLSGESFKTTYKEKDLPIVLPELTKSGSIFEGWYTNENFEGDSITTIDTLGERSINLYAKFTEIDYKLKVYKGNYDDNPVLLDEIELNYGDLYSIDVEALDGYEISKIYYLLNDSKVDLETNGSYLFEHNVDVYVIYFPIEYNITYVLNDGMLLSGALKEKYIVSDEFDLPILEKVKYQFDGWYDNEDFEGDAILSINAGTIGNKIFYAKFSEKQYAISLYFGNHLGEVKYLDELKLKYNQEYSLRNDYVNGYVITGYYYLLDGFQYFIEFNGQYTFENDLVLYGLSDVIYYDITYHTDGGTLEGSNVLPSKYNITSYIYLSGLVKEGYIFEGWFDNELFEGEAIEGINPGRTGEIALYAKFTQYEYNVTVDNSAYGLDDIKFDVIYSLEYEISVANIEGASFRGYYTSPNGLGLQVCDSNGKSIYVYDWFNDMIFYPYYEPEVYGISYNYPGGSLSFTPKYQYTVFDKNVELPIVYYMDYKFLGWYEDESFNSEAIFSIDASSMKHYVLYARCEEVYYNCNIAYQDVTITFDLQYDNKKIIQTINYESGQYLFEYPEHPIREGYIFGGWYKTPECDDNDIIYLSSFPSNNTTIYAKWIEIPEEISNSASEIVHLDFTKCSLENPLNYTISQECSSEAPTVFIMLLDPKNYSYRLGIRGDSNVNVSVGQLWSDGFNQTDSYILSSDYTTSNGSAMKYSILMIYVYGNGTEFDVSIYVDGMYEYKGIDICHKSIVHFARLQVLSNIGDYVLKGIYTEPNGQGELLSNTNEVLSELLYDGIVVYPYYVLDINA